MLIRRFLDPSIGLTPACWDLQIEAECHVGYRVKRWKTKKEKKKRKKRKGWIIRSNIAMIPTG